jgi:hypothetical protein
MEKMKLGAAITAISQRLDMNDRQIALRCYMSEGGVRLWRLGKVRPTKVNSVERLKELAASAGIEIEGL